MQLRLHAIAAACALCCSASGEVLVIVNQNVAIEAIEAGDLRDLFLGKQTHIASTSIEPVVLPEGGTHDEFLKADVGVTPSQYRTYWKKMVFTGQGRYPTSAADEADMVARVARTPGAIGYIDAATAHDNAKVKVVAVRR